MIKISKGVQLQALLVLLTVLLTNAGGEVGLRILQYLKHGTPLILQLHGSEPLGGAAFELDDQLGWRVAPHRQFVYERRDMTGTSYKVLYSTGSHGFRAYGDPNSDDVTKLFIVGDSFTHAEQVSNEETYYSVLRSSLPDNIPVQIFAYGAGGYGTLQEVMIIERYISVIQPSILIVQVCSNDFINNSYELERASYENNNRHIRPYLGLDGAITMQIPQSYLRTTIIKLSSYSRLLFWVMSRFDAFTAVHASRQTIEYDIHKKRESHPGFMRAVEITDRLLDRLRGVVPAGMKIYAFSVDDRPPFTGTFEALFAKHNITYIRGIPEAMRNAATSGKVVFAEDGAHWAPAGHAIVGKILADELRFDLVAGRSTVRQ